MDVSTTVEAGRVLVEVTVAVVVSNCVAVEYSVVKEVTVVPRQGQSMTFGLVFKALPGAVIVCTVVAVTVWKEVSSSVKVGPATVRVANCVMVEGGAVTTDVSVAYCVVAYVGHVKAGTEKVLYHVSVIVHVGHV